MRTLRLRFAVGVALGAAVGVWLAHGFVSEGRARIAAAKDQRSAVIARQARVSSGGRGGGQGDAIRKLVPAWQAGSAGISQVRIVRGAQLEASTAPADTGDKAAPRRLARDEKPLYDLAQ